ncbi:McrB family protein [Planococcus sp. 107-1]|uniref:McrB family protein n=1 Tax=Planococcus sp. 107-1 TaxID=2908840 RepID=UPI001F22A519|nr:hypothetical protein [Planococcus sp. 107-1]UJF26665.1 hypothetical protein L0M13_16240 [Planococcus sp. 107-1]
MTYSYTFTHNLRSESDFRTNITKYSNILKTNYASYSPSNTTERNKFTELLSYLHLKDHHNQSTQICEEVLMGNTDIALFNFIEKFQYPNFCSTQGPNAKGFDIKLVPVRTILKLLYIKFLSKPTSIPYLTLDEISKFIFSNPDVYLDLKYDSLEFWNDIKDYRSSGGTLPSKISNTITIGSRTLREMLNLFSYSKFVYYSDNNKQINLDFLNLPQDLQDTLIRIISCESFFEINDVTSATKDAYYEYIDLPKVTSTLTPNMDLNHILSWFNSNPDQIYDVDLIANFHISLNCLPDKHFLIISGVSGTGKTNLIKQYANAVYNNTTIDNNPYFKLISVRPDWEDEKALFGYYNALEKKYEISEFLKTLLQARFNPDKNYFICLDEMNLAHVEYYFSDYLSAVESNEPIILNNFYISELPIPQNVYIVGTINEDETTERISDKVWDRAFKVEMNNVNINQYLNEYCNTNRKELKIITDLNFLATVNSELAKENMQFGYRLVKEMIEKLDYNYVKLSSYFPTKDLIDNTLLEKVIPKIKIEIVTLEVLKNIESIIQASSYPKTNSKLNEMIEILESSSAIW